MCQSLEPGSDPNMAASAFPWHLLQPQTEGSLGRKRERTRSGLWKTGAGAHLCKAGASQFSRIFRLGWLLGPTVGLGPGRGAEEL